MAQVVIEHIHTDENGIARIAGSRSKVSQIICDIRLGLTPDQIHVEYPHLSLGQIHAALSYYYDHQAEIDAQIDSSLVADDQLSAKAGASFSKSELLSRARLTVEDRAR